MFGGLNFEFDIFGGYKRIIGNGIIDVGLIWYMYLGGVLKIDFVEFYVKLSGMVGLVIFFIGVVYVFE